MLQGMREQLTALSRSQNSVIIAEVTVALEKVVQGLAGSKS